MFVLSAIAQYVGATVAIDLFDEVHPAAVAWLRVIGASVALVVVSLPRVMGRISRAEYVAMDLCGTATALMNTFFYLAVDRLPLGKGVTIEFIGPIIVAALRTRSVRNAVALGFAVVGVAVLSGVELG
ncbi:MAG: EamA family transporter, partial [Actinomycetota bacterium]